MKFEYSILLPPTALVFLTGFVWLRLGSDRLGEMRSRRIHPQRLGLRRAARGAHVRSSHQQ